MTSSNILINNQLLKLSLELSTFGLRPIDWRIIKHSKNSFKIAHIHEDNFYFIGQIKNENDISWKTIQLAGL